MTFYQIVDRASGPNCAPGEKCKPDCPPVPSHPADADVNKNIKEAEEVNTLGWINPATHEATNATWLTVHVLPHGSWDYKRQDVQYDEFGNFNYGATAAALGIPLQDAQAAAGLVAIFGFSHDSSQYGSWYQAPYYGHPPSKSTAISNGYKYYQKGCNK